VKLGIFGAGGHGRVVQDIALSAGWHEVVFFDDSWPTLTTVESCKVVGNSSTLMSKLDELDGVHIAVGSNSVRMSLFEHFRSAGGVFPPLVHPMAVVSPSAILAEGVAVMPGAVINAGTIIGRSTIVNSGSTVDHDCNLGEGVHIAPGAHLAGNVSIGFCSWVGIGAAIIQNTSIGSRVVVGAGAVVLTDVLDGTTVAGVPAKTIG